MALLAEQAAPSWVPFVAFLVPALIVAAVLIPALRSRRRASAARRSQRRRRSADATELGSGARIDDPAPYSIEALLKALAIAPEDHGPTADGMPHDEGWMGTMLGLKSRMSAASEVLEPHVHWGTRQGRQVFIRIGPDEKLEGGTTMLSNRHIRAITVLRVDAPAFDIASDGGTLRGSEESPDRLQGLVERLAADRSTWSNVLIAGGPAGIVAARSAIDGTAGSWVYDLWLCERIAGELDLEPLKPARVGPRWKVPYGFGKSLEPVERSRRGAS
ncbi:MAG TPA: hypothetical protein VFB44_03315 [Thermoleophilaceae bacterium]|nr:hypothetical protein [Thermoleophilaceae bacterium]